MFFGDYLNPSVFMHPFHTAPKFSRGWTGKYLQNGPQDWDRLQAGHNVATLGLDSIIKKRDFSYSTYWCTWGRYRS
jgi:hypothetical protein